MRQQIAMSLTFMLLLEYGCCVVPNTSVSAALRAAASETAGGTEIQLRSLTDFK